MAYPTRLLGQDELLALDLRPHWKALVWPVTAFLAVAVLAGYLLAVIPEWDGTGRWVRYLVAGAALVGLVRWTLAPWLRWVTTGYTLTSRRVITRAGVLTREGRDMPLGRITDVSFSHDSLLERLLGCGTLVVESGGQAGQLELVSIPAVEDAQRELYRLMEEEAKRRYWDGDGTEDLDEE